MIRITAPDRAPLIAVLTTTGERFASGAPSVFPEFGAKIWERVAAMA
jgi:hypothetical protein